MILLLILGLFKINIIIWKKNNKKSLINFYNYYDFKIVFILLLKIIIIYIKNLQISIYKLNIKKKPLKSYLYLGIFYKYFYKLFKKKLIKKKIRNKIKTQIEILLLLIIDFFISF